MKRLVRAPLLLLCLAAPTAGDIGSCGQPIADLDPVAFFEQKAAIDCNRCQRCRLTTNLCKQTCASAPRTAFDANCFPLVHDGEVCLDALKAASCSEYAAYVDDAAPTVPTECDFCPLSQRPAQSASSAGGAAGVGGAATASGPASSVGAFVGAGGGM